MRTIIVIGIGAICAIGLSSCVSVKDKQRVKFDKYVAENPGYIANICATSFPAQLEYIKGKETIVIDTVYTEGAQLPCPDGTKVKCPDIMGFIKTKERTDTLLKENTARLSMLTAEDIYNKKAIKELLEAIVVKDALIKEYDKQNKRLIKDLEKSKPGLFDKILRVCGGLFIGTGLLLIFKRFI